MRLSGLLGATAKAARIPVLFYLGLSVILCFTPLFNLLGYEFAFAIGILAALTASLQSYRYARAHHSATLVHWLPRIALLVLLPLALPLALILMNALRVRNCNFVEGFAFYALIPVANALYGASIGLFVACLTSGRRRLGPLLLALALVVPLAWTLAALYWQPPIFAFDHLWGHFAGSLYDESIAVDSRLLMFRLGTLLRIIAIMLGVLIWTHRQRLSILYQVLLPLVLVSGLAMYEYKVGHAFGFRIGRSYIETELPIIETRAGLVLHLPKETTAAERRALADDHAFRLQQIQERLGVTLDRSIHSYVYRDARQKARLMGGRGTMIAKPWLSEIHIHGLQTPHLIMAHEMVHAISAAFGSPFLGVSARGHVLVNMGLVEGVAEAVAPERGSLDLDHWTRAMRELNIAPDMRKLLGPTGFWGQAPQRAYTVAGSFVRYLLNTRGAPSFQAAYTHGNFEHAYGQSLDSLVTQWEAYVDALPLTAREQRIAEERFRTPSIFSKACAHEIAQLREQAKEASPAEAIQIYTTICKHLDDSPDAQLELAYALIRAENRPEFYSLSQKLLDGTELNMVQRALLCEARGEILWKDDRRDDARRMFEHARDAQVSPESERMQWVRLWALEQDATANDPTDTRARVLRNLLTGETSPIAAVLELQEQSLRFSDDKTYPYLIARQLHGVDAWELALLYLKRAEPHPYHLIEAERLRLEADAYWQLQLLDEAEKAYARYAEMAPTTGEKVRALDWIARIHWDRTSSPQL